MDSAEDFMENESPEQAPMDEGEEYDPSLEEPMDSDDAYEPEVTAEELADLQNQSAQSSENVSAKKKAKSKKKKSSASKTKAKKSKKKKATGKRKRGGAAAADDDDDDDDFQSPPGKKAKKASQKKKVPKQSSSSSSSSSSSTSSSTKTPAKPKTASSARKQKKTGSSEKKKQKKKPKAKVTHQEVDERVKAYMLGQNRPHNKKNVYENMKRFVSEGQILKSLESLSKAGGPLAKKQIGKSAFFYADQDQLPALSQAEMEALTAEVQSLVERESAAKASLGTTKHRHSALRRELPDDELEAELGKLREETKAMRTDVAKFEGSTTQLDPKAKAKKEKRLKKFKKEWKRRKEACMELVNKICEGQDKKPDDVTSSIGIETDKEAGVSWKTCCA